MAGVLRSSLLNLAATVVSLVTGFLVSIIVARLLGPSGSGTVAFMMWLAVSACAIADLGMPQTVLRYVAGLAQDEERRAVVNAAFRRFSRAVGAVFALAAAYALYRFSHADAGGWLWSAVAVLFVAYALAAFSTAAARGHNRFGETAASTVIGGLIQIPLVFAGAWFFGPAGALAGMLTKYLPQALRLGRYVDFRRAGTAAALAPDMRSYGRHMWLSDMIDIVALSRIEFLILGFFLSATEIGYFAVAIVFAGLIGQFALQLSPALIVGFSAEPPDGGQAESDATLYASSIRLIALVFLPVGLGGAAVIPALLPPVFGEDFRPATSAATTLLAFSALMGFSVVPWSYLAARGHGKSLMITTSFSAAAIMLMLLVAIPAAGVPGAAVARAATETLSLGMLLMIVRAKGGPAFPFATVSRILAAAFLCALSAHGVLQILPSLPGVAAAIGAGAVVYAMAIRLLRVIEAEEMEMLTEPMGARLPEPLKAVLRGFARALAPRAG
ncbi:MAG: lipopolysaccharide biosynthesis protein [Shinella sp.]|nr:lipopolysaccharide biosynthesis protein [Shinella sp.]